MINYIIPVLLGLSCLAIALKSMDEWQKRRRKQQLKEWFENENKHR